MPRRKIVTQKYKIYLPEGLDLAEMLPDDLKAQADAAKYFVHLLYFRRVTHRHRPDSFVNLKYAYLRHLLGQKKFDRLRAWLLEHVVECDNDYHFRKNGNPRPAKSFGYRLREPWLGARHHEDELTDQRLIRRIRRAYADLDAVTLANPVHAHLHRHLQTFTFDQAGANNWINSDSCVAMNRDGEPVEPESYRDTLKMQGKAMLDLPRYMKTDIAGRVHTPLTSLETNLRAFLTHRGEGLTNVDIRNSQPLFFGIVLLNWLASGTSGLGEAHSFSLHSWRRMLETDFPKTQLTSINSYLNNPSLHPLPLRCIFGTSIPPDSGLYIRLCEEGKLYEYLMDQANIHPDRRREYKKRLFGRVFFRRNCDDYAEARMFQGLFPTVDALIRRIKKNDYKALPRLLQKVESDLMIHRVCDRMRLEHPDVPIATIHDSIILPTADVNVVERILTQEFAHIGLSPSFRHERLGSTTEPGYDDDEDGTTTTGDDYECDASDAA